MRLSNLHRSIGGTNRFECCLNVVVDFFCFWYICSSVHLGVATMARFGLQEHHMLEGASNLVKWKFTIKVHLNHVEISTHVGNRVVRW
jgi:hypothetical protein